MGSESKEYTAEEMREMADAIAADLNDCGHTSATYGFDDLLPITQCLRQAADAVERYEKVNNGLKTQIRQLVRRCQAAEAKLYKIKKIAVEDNA